MATRAVAGAISFRAPNHLPTIDGSYWVNPVIIAARARKARDKAVLDRSRGTAENDRNHPRLARERCELCFRIGKITSDDR